MQAEQNIIQFPQVSNRPFVPPSIEEVIEHGATIGLPSIEAEKLWHFYTANGWRVGKNPMKVWKSALAGWKLRWQERGGETQFVKSIAKSPAPNYAITTLKAKRFEEVKARIKTIRDGLSGLNTYTPEEREELKQLKAERDLLSAELGLA